MLTAKQKLTQPFRKDGSKAGSKYECFSVADEAYDVSGSKAITLPLQEQWRPYAIGLCVLSLAATLTLAVLGFVYSVDVGNGALFGFGATCVLDFLSTVFVLWRFLPNQKATSAAYELEQERLASLRIAILFIVAFFVILGKCTYHLVMHQGPSGNKAVLILSYVSLGVCLLLAAAKILLADRLVSPSMKTDGVNSLAGAAIASGALVSYYVYRSHSSVWYISSAVGILIAFVLLVMGVTSVIKLRTRRPSEDFNHSRTVR